VSVSSSTTAPAATATSAPTSSARATPDGYTLLVTTNATIVINPQIFTKVVQYDPVKDFTPISLLASQPLVLVVHPSMPVKTVPELIALARAKPGTLNFASSGSGGSAHLAGEMLKSMAKIDMTYVPYKGSAPALVALLGGEINFMFTAILTAMPLVEQNRLRAIAVSTAKRNPAAPNLPAVAEFPGLEEFVSDLWYGLLAPSKVSPAIVDRLYKATQTALSNPDVKKRIESSGTRAAGQFAEGIRADHQQRRQTLGQGDHRGQGHGGKLKVIRNIQWRLAFEQ